jgi:hypothetical protein
MATRTQKQTEWALWIKNLAKTLESPLADIRHQEESKLRHTEPLVLRKLLHTLLYWENRWAASASVIVNAATGGSKPACETSDQAGKHHVSCRIPPATPGLNQKSPQGRLTQPPKKTEQ